MAKATTTRVGTPTDAQDGSADYSNHRRNLEFDLDFPPLVHDGKTTDKEGFTLVVSKKSRKSQRGRTHQRQSENPNFESDLWRWRRSLFSVFVGNIDTSKPFRDLAVVVNRVATVRDWYAPMLSKRDRRPSFGFLRFKTREEADKVVCRFNGWKWQSRFLRLNEEYDRQMATATPKAIKDGKPNQTWVRKKTLNTGFVGNRSFVDVVSNEQPDLIQKIHDDQPTTDNIENELIWIEKAEREREVSGNEENTNCITLPPTVGWESKLDTSVVLGLASIPKLQVFIDLLFTQYPNCKQFSFMGGCLAGQISHPKKREIPS